MTGSEVVEWTRRIADLLDRHGWRDLGDTALTLARSIASGESTSAAVRKVPNRFFVQNGIDRQSFVEALHTLGPHGPAMESQDEPVPTALPQDQPSESRVRWVGAAAGTVVAAVVAFALPRQLWWPRLMDHPNSLAIRSLAVFCVALLGIGYAHQSRRELLLGGALGAAAVLLSLLGR